MNEQGARRMAQSAKGKNAMRFAPCALPHAKIIKE